jgi:hypothetical protein
MYAQLIPIKTLAQLQEQEKAEADKKQHSPAIQGLAAHVEKRFQAAKSGKRALEDRMLQAVRQRRGEYDPDKKQAIAEIGGSGIYVMLASSKCRAAAAWLNDSLLGTGADKPWRLELTAEPTLPPDLMQALQIRITERLYAQVEMTGTMPPPEVVRQMATEARDAALRDVREEAHKRVERMERKIEDQLQEGGFQKAMHEFIDDLTTFPFACIKGPVVRMRKQLVWEQGQMVVQESPRLEWERVDPFMVYWGPWGRSIDETYFIEHHKMTREDLEALIGVEGYSEAQIRAVLENFGGGGLSGTDTVVAQKATAEGRELGEDDGSADLVDAYQLWDTVPGKLLIDWGLSAEEIDPGRSYPCEAWKVKDRVIKAVLNYDPLGRKPYYITSYEKLAGKIEGNGVTDLCRDSADMVNSAARNLANNMGISSGPQVGINISRLPTGENITQMYPWKLWQFTASDYNDGSPPISFFQPNSNAQELMAVFERFVARADEDTGIPRYMSGEHVPGVGRTSSGMAMLISNAGKGIKQVISNVDHDILTKLLERLYHHNVRYSQDNDFIGDANIVAKGAMSLVVKEAEAARQREFLQLVLQNPTAQQIVGLPGAAELLRDAAKTLNGNVDRIVPSREDIARMVSQQAQLAQMTQMAQAGPPENVLPDGVTPQGGRDSNFISPRPNGV